MTDQVRVQKVASYGNAYEQLVAALKQFPVEMWQFRPAAEQWTIHELIVHIADSEANSFVRCRKAIAEPGSTVAAYNEPRWASVLRYHEQSTEEALELFKCLRRASYNVIKSLPESVWAQTIEHPENGTMTLDDWLKVYEAHVREHIAQMQRVHEDWLKVARQRK